MVFVAWSDICIVERPWPLWRFRLDSWTTVRWSHSASLLSTTSRNARATRTPHPELCASSCARSCSRAPRRGQDFNLFFPFALSISSSPVHCVQHSSLQDVWLMGVRAPVATTSTTSISSQKLHVMSLQKKEGEVGKNGCKRGAKLCLYIRGVFWTLVDKPPKLAPSPAAAFLLLEIFWPSKIPAAVEQRGQITIAPAWLHTLYMIDLVMAAENRHLLPVLFAGTSTSRSTATLVPGTKLQRVEADLHIAK